MTSSVQPPCRQLYRVMKSSLSLLFSSLNHFISLSCSSSKPTVWKLPRVHGGQGSYRASLVPSLANKLGQKLFRFFWLVGCFLVWFVLFQSISSNWHSHTGQTCPSGPEFRLPSHTCERVQLCHLPEVTQEVCDNKRISSLGSCPLQENEML